MSNNRRNGLRWAGLIVGLGWVAWMLFALLTTCSRGLDESHLFNAVLLYFIPLLAMVAVAWKRPLIGGILLIAVGLFWPVLLYIPNIIGTGPSRPLLNVLQGLVYLLLLVSLPMLVSGILFLLSGKRERDYSYGRGELIPKLRWAGLIIMGLAGIACFSYEAVMREFLGVGLLLVGSPILLAVAAWAWPLGGGIMGVGYSLFVIAYLIITQSEGRTLLQLLSDSDYILDIIPMIVLLIGSILVLVSSRKIVREES